MMGGKALQGMEARRISRTEYPALERHAIALLEEALPGIACRTVPQIQEKADFGDIDILVGVQSLPEDWLHRVHERLAPRAASRYPNDGAPSIAKSGGTFSFELAGAQIDLSFHDDHLLDFAADYCGYSGLGDLLAEPARGWGFLMDHRGLRLAMEQGGEHFDLLTVSADFGAILELLRYEAQEWASGFQTFEESYRFLVSSPFFDAEPHLAESNNHHQRKRASYQQFVEWLRVNQHVSCAPLHEPDPMARVFGHFPGFKKTYDASLARRGAAIAFRRRFNGQVVRAQTGLEGKELGGFLEWLAASRGGQDNFRDEVLSLSDKGLRRLIRTSFGIWSAKKDPAP